MFIAALLDTQDMEQLKCLSVHRLMDKANVIYMQWNAIQP